MLNCKIIFLEIHSPPSKSTFWFNRMKSFKSTVIGNQLKLCSEKMDSKIFSGKNNSKSFLSVAIKFCSLAIRVRLA